MTHGSASRRPQRASRLATVLTIIAVITTSCATDESDPTRPTLTREQLLDPQQCKDCHPKHYAEWSASMHAYASKDPVFLAMNKRGQEETGGELGAFCVNCHAPMAVRERALPDYAEVAALPEHLQGVTCYFCHNAEAVGPEHYNADIQLAADTTMRAALDRALTPSTHGVAYSSFHDRDHSDSSTLCGTCHDIVNQHGLHLERTLSEYRTSFVSNAAQPTLFQSCQSCHMKATLGVAASLSGNVDVQPGERAVHEHLFPGVDLPLSDVPGADALRSAVEQCALPSSISYFNVVPRGALAAFSVFMETQAGHAQPSGATQDRRMWLEVEGYDDAGTKIYAEGAIADGQFEQEPGAAPHPCMLRDHIADEAGHEVHMFWEAAQLTSSRLIPVPTSPIQNTHSVECSFGPPSNRPLARLEFRLRIRPIGVDVLQDLVASGHLAREVVARMPTLTVDQRTAHYDAVKHRYIVNDDNQVDCDTYRGMLGFPP